MSGKSKNKSKKKSSNSAKAVSHGVSTQAVRDSDPGPEVLLHAEFAGEEQDFFLLTIESFTEGFQRLFLLAEFQ